MSKRALQQAADAAFADLDDLRNALDLETLTPFVDVLNSFRPLFLTGQGRTGLIVQAWAQRLMQIDRNAHVVGLPTTPAITDGATLIACSGSGQTDTTRLYMQKAKDIGARVGLITSKADAPLMELADFHYVLRADSNRQPLRSQFEQSLLLVVDMLSLALMTIRQLSDDDITKRHANLQ
jgi:6-phospho-3-hexuloisomerase